MVAMRLLGLVVAGIIVSLSSQASSVAPASRAAVALLWVPHDGIQPEVIVDHRGVLHVLYISGEARGGNLFYARSTDYGSTFAAPIPVNSQDGSAIATGTISGWHLPV